MIIHGLKGRDFNSRSPLRSTSDGSIYDWDRPVATLACKGTGDILTYNADTGLVSGQGWVNTDATVKNVTLSPSKTYDLSRFVVIGMNPSGGPGNDVTTHDVRLKFEDEEPIYLCLKVQHGIIKIVGIKEFRIKYTPGQVNNGFDAGVAEVTLYGHLKK